MNEEVKISNQQKSGKNIGLWNNEVWAKSDFMHFSTLKSQIEGYTRLFIFRKFSILPAVTWAYPLINFQENFQPPCFFTYTDEKKSILPVLISA